MCRDNVVLEAQAITEAIYRGCDLLNRLLFLVADSTVRRDARHAMEPDKFTVQGRDFIRQPGTGHVAYLFIRCRRLSLEGKGAEFA